MSDKVHLLFFYFFSFSLQDDGMNGLFLIDPNIDDLMFELEKGEELLLESVYLLFGVVLTGAGNFAIHILFDLIANYKVRLMTGARAEEKSEADRKRS